MLDSLLCRLAGFSCPPPRLIYPEGAYIPPPETVERFSGLSSAGGRPVMDAAAAQAHNATLFHGALTWGPVMGLVLVVFAYFWFRPGRS